jgi:O-antigen/teichoic acid export membrane protein
MTAESWKQRARRGLSWTVISGLIAHGGRLLLLLALARLWTPGDFGLAALIFTLINFLLFFVDLGMSQALLSRADPEPVTLSTLSWAAIGAGILLMLVVLLLAGPAAAFFRLPQLEPVLWLAAPQLPLSAVGLPQRVLWRKELRFAALGRLEVASFGGYAIVTLALALAGYGVAALLWGTLAGQSIAAVLAWAWSRPAQRPRHRFRFAELAAFRSFGLYQLGDRALSYLAQRSDTVVIGRLLGPAALGPYDLTKQMLARPEALINPMLGQVAMPVMARGRGEPAFVATVYLRLVGHISAIQFPIYAFLAVAAAPVLAVVLGAPWRDTAPVFRWLAVYYALHATFNPVGALLLALGAARRAFWWNIMLLAGLAVSTWVGLYGGTLGVAQALGILYLVLQGPFYVWFIRPLTGLSPRRYFAVFLPPLACTVICLPLAAAGVYALPENIWGLAVTAAFYFLGYAVVSWFWQRGFMREALGFFGLKV